jgi:hypothetical protein
MTTTRTPRRSPLPIYRCPCCRSVLALVDGALRRVPTDPRCRACGHNRGSHLGGHGCIGGGVLRERGEAPLTVGPPGPCGCAYFHDDLALIARAARTPSEP